ncbi:arsenate reductase [Sphingomonas abaci]|uniref:Arsenate reductase n=2 Tax=Sphingomonas abaci TaxID=237611 RepID=A0A7W7AH15_9SPHN|nr:arsenate reductase [Sphingomonas abaci]
MSRPPFAPRAASHQPAFRAHRHRDLGIPAAAAHKPVMADPHRPAATLYHYPRCSKSRAALALLEAAGAEVTIIDYLNDPPDPAELARLYARAGLTAAQGLRRGEAGTAALAGADDATILVAMAADPILIERPLVETERGVVLARPPERVTEVL